MMRSSRPSAVAARRKSHAPRASCEWARPGEPVDVGLPRREAAHDGWRAAWQRVRATPHGRAVGH
eukprot:1754839-Lingulodinium_polyedra.AAC.1